MIAVKIMFSEKNQLKKWMFYWMHTYNRSDINIVNNTETIWEQ